MLNLRSRPLVSLSFFAWRVAALIVVAWLGRASSGFAQELRQAKDVDGLFFTIQVGSFRSPSLPPSMAHLSQDIIHKKIPNNLNRFSVGVYRDMNTARRERDLLIEDGFNEAFIIAYENDRRVSLKDVRDRALKSNQNTVANVDLEQVYTIEVMDVFENEILDYSPINNKRDIREAVSLLTPDPNKIDLDTFLDPSKSKTPIGLNLSSYYANNLENGFSNYEDIFYTERINFGLEWNLLRDGLLEGKIQRQRFDNLNEIQAIETKRELREQFIRDQHNLITYLFHAEKERVLANQLQLRNRQVTIAEILFSSRKLTWDELISIRADRDRTKDEMESTSNFIVALQPMLGINDGLEQLIQANGLPLLSVDPNQLLRDSGLISDFEHIQSLKQANLDLQQGVMQSISLKPFANYNLTQDLNSNNQNFATVGIALKVPIAGQHSQLSAESIGLRIEDEKTNARVKGELIQHYLHYLELMEQVRSVQIARALTEEKLRKEIIRYQLESSSFSGLNGIDLLIQLDHHTSELLELQMRMYQVLLQMSLYRNDRLESYCQVEDLNQYGKRFREPRKSSLSDDFFFEHDNLFIIHYIQSNEIVEIACEVSRLESPKWSSFIEMCHSNRLKVTAIYDDKTFLDKGDSEDVLSRASLYRSMGFDGITLLTSPHNYSDFEGRADFYLGNYSKVVSDLRMALSDSDFSIETEVSTTYPENWQKIMLERSDYCTVNIDLFEQPDRTKNKIENSLFTNSTECNIALSAHSFPNRLFMEKYIESLQLGNERYPITIEGLDELYSLDYNASFGE